MEETDKIELNNVICPFCGERDFDLIGLKHHLINYCESYFNTEEIKVIFNTE